ncbi:MAG: hypothetical protein ABSH34_30600 [Verrucomicrobiota bacterium]
MDWAGCERRVRRLQARIVKATCGLSLTGGLNNGLSRMISPRESDGAMSPRVVE